LILEIYPLFLFPNSFLSRALLSSIEISTASSPGAAVLVVLSILDEKGTKDVLLVA